MSDHPWTPGPWVFEPHGLFGTTVDGENTPFGYVHTIAKREPVPIFELGAILVWDEKELASNARLIAAAPELYEALYMVRALFTCGLTDSALEEIDAVLRKARGEA